jgi:transposase
MQRRRSFTAEFKAKVAIEALKEQQTLQELAQKHELPHYRKFSDSVTCGFSQPESPHHHLPPTLH